MNRLLTFIIISLMFLFACGDKVAAEVTKTRAEVIAVHDEVMPKMTEIADLQKQVKAKISAMQADTVNAKSLQEQMNAALQVDSNLSKAEKAMNDWMVDFHEVMEQKVDAQKMLDAMKGEQTKINKVKDDMLSAIEAAKSYLGNE